MLKQILGFILNGVVYYLLLKLNKYNVDRLFRVYLNLAFIVALIGIFQAVCFSLHFKPGFDYSYFLARFKQAGNVHGIMRVSSILPEPSHFGAAMMPAVFVAILNIFKRDNKFINLARSFLIVISVVLSFSLVSYAGIICACILVMANYRKFKLIFFGVLAITIFTVAVYTYSPALKRKVDDTAAVLTGKIGPEKTNMSTFAMVTNALVAYKSLMHNPVFGSGLGSHPISYDKYNTCVINPKVYTVAPCKGDSGSLFLRLISETGLLGLGIFLFFIFKFYVSYRENEYLWVISNSIVSLFFINLLRMGNYFSGGFIFFVWLYYFVGKKASSQNLK
ncbi:MAG: O-antigen ligase family protein [Candidatus Omnitrophica bacterium]|nr:O-antigen ligase family protein [Candidatus Omnitrophota bacterium]